ncbi:MAG: hypothetical protein HUU35_01345 [Armatimonadetes bacterium]|nr:hypothetical protein [Armatimonadota bacterium]
MEPALTLIEGLGRIGASERATLARVWEKITTGGDATALLTLQPVDLQAALLPALAMDLARELPVRPEFNARSLLLLSGYERLLHGLADVAAARQTDRWMQERVIASLRQLRIQVVVTSEAELEERNGLERLEQHRLEGLDADAARQSLRLRGLADETLVEAIVNCAREEGERDQVITVLPFALHLCHDVAENARSRDRKYPSPEVFLRLPDGPTIDALADLFLQSLPSSEDWERWVGALALPLWFTEASARSLVQGLGLQMPGTCWEHLLRFSFVSAVPGATGRYTLHAVMRRALRRRLDISTKRKAAEALIGHHESIRARMDDGDSGNAWHVRFLEDPRDAAGKLTQSILAAIEQMQGDLARRLLGWMDGVDLQEDVENDEDRAFTLICWGDALVDAPVLDPRRRREEAISAYGKALELLGQDGEAKLVVAARSQLGKALMARQQGDDLRAAVENFDAALSLDSPDIEALDRISIRMNRASTLVQLAKDNPEVARTGYVAECQRLIRELPPDTPPLTKGLFWHNMASILLGMDFLSAEHVEQALDTYATALNYFTQSGHLRRSVYTLTDMSMGLRKLSQTSSGRLDWALEQIRAVAGIVKEDQTPHEWAWVQREMGAVLTLKADLARESVPVEAVEALAAAGRVFEQEEATAELGLTQRYLLSALRRTGREADLPNAAQAGEGALSNWQPSLPIEVARLGKALAEVYLGLQQPDRAVELLDAAIGIYENSTEASEWAYALFLKGYALSAGGDSEQTGSLWAEALRILRERGLTRERGELKALMERIRDGGSLPKV